MFWMDIWILVTAALHPSWSIRTVVFSGGEFFRGRRTQRYALPSLLLSRSRSQGQLNLEFGTVPQSASHDVLDLQLWLLHSCWKPSSYEMSLVRNVFTQLVRRGHQKRKRLEVKVCVPSHPAGQWWNRDDHLSHLNEAVFIDLKGGFKIFQVCSFWTLTDSFMMRFQWWRAKSTVLCGKVYLKLMTVTGFDELGLLKPHMN